MLDSVKKVIECGCLIFLKAFYLIPSAWYFKGSSENEFLLTIVFGYD